jgi:hypothetical protein
MRVPSKKPRPNVPGGAPEEPATSDLGAVLADSRPEIERIMGTKVPLDLRLPKTPVRVSVSGTQLYRLLQRLADLAANDMPRQGVLEIGLAETEVAGEPRGIPHGRYAVLTLKTTGGRPLLASVARLFQSKSGTWAVGEGLGSDLGSLFELLESSGAHLRVSVEPGLRATLTLFFPRAR